MEQASVSASSIHTRSTISKKYDIDTSAMIIGQQNDFKVSDVENSSIPLGKLIIDFTLDFGRHDIKLTFFHYLRLLITPILLMLTACDFSAIQKNSDAIPKVFNDQFKVFQLLLSFVPENINFYTALTVHCTILFIYFTLIVFLLTMLNDYKQNTAPKTWELDLWIIVSRSFIPILTPYISFLFFNSLYHLIFDPNYGIQHIIYLIISIALMCAQFVIIYFSSACYNATPLIRKRDFTQPWFSYSSVDWEIPLVLFFMMGFPLVLLEIPEPILSIMSMLIVSFICIFYAHKIIKNLPYIHMKMNLALLTAFIAGPPFSTLPLFSYYLPTYVGYVFYAFLVCVIPSYCLARVLISRRVKTVIQGFSELANDHKDFDQPLDPLSLAILQLNQTKMVQFEMLNISKEDEFSLYIRIGFLYDVKEIDNCTFIRWVLNRNQKANPVLSAAQVAYAVQSDLRVLNSLESICGKVTQAPYNTKSFNILFNHMRQELLTQLNQPLLNAVGKAKRSNSELQSKISDFWGAILKQRTDQLIVLIPEIAEYARRTDILFQQLNRNYPKSPTVLRETILFYDKSLGDHHKTVDLQSSYNRSKGRPDDDTGSETTTTFGSLSNVDIEFHEHMEPWLVAQDHISQLPSIPKRWFFATICITLISMIGIPAVVLAISMNSINDFNNVVYPIESIGSLLHAICRIPQLVRRKELFARGEVQPWDSSTGPPLGTLLEFLTEDKVLPSIQNYLAAIKENNGQFVSMCQSGQVLHDACTAEKYQQNYGNKVQNVSLFHLVTSFTNYAEDVLEHNETDAYWKTVSNTDAGKFFTYNFQDAYVGMQSLLSILLDQLPIYRSYFKENSYIFTGVVCGFPLLILLPLFLYSMYRTKRELEFMSRLFFQVSKAEISSLRWSTKTKKKVGRTANLISNGDTTAGLSTIEANEEKNMEMMSNFAMASRGHSGMYTSISVFLTIFVMATVLITLVGNFVFLSSMIDIIDTSMAYVESINVASSALASYVWTQEVFSKHTIYYDYNTLKSKGNAFLKDFVQSFDSFLYRDKGESIPGILLGEEVITMYLRSKTHIDVPETPVLPVNGFMHNVYFAMSCESQMRMLDTVSRYVLGETSPQVYQYTFDDIFVYHYEHLLFCHIDGFLQDGKTLFRSIIAKQNASKIDKLTIALTLLFVAQFIFFFTLIFRSYENLSNAIDLPRSILQLVNPEALLKSQTILKWLSGSYTASTVVRTADHNSTQRASACEFALQNTRCGLIVANEESKIERINKMAQTLLRCEEDEVLIGTDFVDLFTSHFLEKDKHHFSMRLEKEVSKMRKGSMKCNSYEFTSSVLAANSQIAYIGVYIEGHPDIDIDDEFAPAKSFTAILVDRTTEHFQEMLIESEKAKSEALITSLLPPSIAKRLNDGETDISFEVRVATVLFSSFVDWNVLIKDMTAVQVVRLLNRVFSAYDEELRNFPAITKVKTIGQIYMVATGLFSDSSVNTAQVTVDFGLKMIEHVKTIAKEEGLPLQITIGVNTGGPVNCGILGFTRPLFDIIGDPVNVSSRMNSTGVPGFIQIPASTYDTIKFLKYSIRERGEIQVKGKGVLKTYLVAPVSAN